MANRECSEQSLAPVDEPSAAELLLSMLVGDPLRAIACLLADEDRVRFRLTCKTTRDHCDRPLSRRISRAAFLRTRSLTVYACDELPHFLPADKERILVLAAQVGCVAVLAELMDVRGCGAVSVRVCVAAAWHGQLEALMWLRGRGLEWGPNVCCGAAHGGHLEMLRYTHEHGCPWDGFTCSSAAAGGHLEVLRYAHEHGCPWDFNTCCAAAGGGHLEVLRYAHEHDCPWHVQTCSSAAEQGHLEVLRYAHEHGCPWDSRTCVYAAGGGHLEVLRYALEHGCPWDWRLESRHPHPQCIRAYFETLRLAALHL